MLSKIYHLFPAILLALGTCTLTPGARTLSLASCNGAENWNQFRGPQGNGISKEGNIPIHFDEAKNIKWKTAVPDSGWSSPVIWKEEIWLTAGNDASKELRLLCFDLNSGELTRNIKVFNMIARKIDPEYTFDSPHLNSPATPTPVVEEDVIFVSFGSQGIACVDKDTGKKLWERRDLRVYQPVRQGSSPIVDNEKLYVAYDGTDAQFFVALNKQTGETAWRTERNVATDWSETLSKRGLTPKKGGKPNDNKKSFATASLINVNGKTQLIAPAAEAIISYDPENGQELWRTVHPGGFNVAARPIFVDGLVYVFTSGLNHFLIAIRPDGRGDITDTHVQWSTYQGTPEIPSPIVTDGSLFMVTAKGGIARCLNAKDGNERWKTRLGGDHWASPVQTDGKLYFCSKDGRVKILQASSEQPETLASNQLNAEFIASPAIAEDCLILRSKTHLYCISEGFTRSEKQVAADVYPTSEQKFGGFMKKEQPKGEDALQVLSKQLREMVRAGTLTGEEARDLYRAAAGE